MLKKLFEERRHGRRTPMTLTDDSETPVTSSSALVPADVVRTHSS
jgi:hypothetical protein